MKLITPTQSVQSVQRPVVSRDLLSTKSSASPCLGPSKKHVPLPHFGRVNAVVGLALLALSSVPVARAVRCPGHQEQSYAPFLCSSLKDSCNDVPASFNAYVNRLPNNGLGPNPDFSGMTCTDLDDNGNVANALATFVATDPGCSNADKKLYQACVDWLCQGVNALCSSSGNPQTPNGPITSPSPTPAAVLEWVDQAPSPSSGETTSNSAAVNTTALAEFSGLVGATFPLFAVPRLIQLGVADWHFKQVDGKYSSVKQTFDKIYGDRRYVVPNSIVTAAIALVVALFMPTDKDCVTERSRQFLLPLLVLLPAFRFIKDLATTNDGKRRNFLNQGSKAVENPQTRCDKVNQNWARFKGVPAELVKAGLLLGSVMLTMGLISDTKGKQCEETTYMPFFMMMVAGGVTAFDACLSNFNTAHPQPKLAP